MSSFYRITKHPITGKWENAFWLDDYYGRHHYGVKFPDETIYDPSEVILIDTISEEEANILNEHKSKR